MANAYISKVTLPSGNSYLIKDKEARELIAQLEGGSYFLGISQTAITNGSTTATITVPDGESTKQVTATNGNIAIYDKKEFIFDGTSWHEFGDLSSIELNKQTATVLKSTTTASAAASTVTFSGNAGTGGLTDVVLGEGTTFALTSGAVTHGTPTTDSVLGADTTFTLNNPTLDPGATTKYMKATASGANTTWNSKDQRTVVTGYASPTTTGFLTSVTPTSKKLATTSITGTNGTETVSKVTKTASKLVTTTIPNVTNNASVSIPNVTSNADKTLTFEVGTGTDNETLIISGSGFPTGSNVYTASLTALGTNLSASKVTLGTAITAATGAVASTGSGSDIVTAVTISDKTVAKVASAATTVATGALTTSGSGADVISEVTVSDPTDAITALGTPSTANVIGTSSTFTITQPTVALGSESATATGRVAYVATSAPTLSGGSITVGDNDQVSAVTAMPTSTVGTAITVGTGDKVTAVTKVGSGTAAAQTITINTTNNTATVLTNATSLTDNTPYGN